MDFQGNERQMAMTIFDGWDQMDLIQSEGTNPDSEKSIYLYASLKREKQFRYEPYILISQVITKCSHVDFTEDELFSINSIEYCDAENYGGYGDIKMQLQDLSVKRICFDEIEGHLEM